MALGFNNAFYWLTVLVFHCLRSILCGTGKNFSSQSLCKKDVGDCSAQVGSTANTCQVYNTSVCEIFDTEQWTTLPITYPLHEKDASFKVSVLPYEGKYIPEQTYHVSAINISLISHSKEINGFYVEVSDSTSNETICRIFDIRKAARIKRKEFSLYYDCLHSLDDMGIYTFVIIARALPLNEELQYLIYLPDASSIEPEEACLWKPLILVFLSSLEANKVSMHFSKAPPFYDIRGYKVSLISEENEDNVITTKSLEPESDNDMMHVEFQNVDIGYYYVQITIHTWKDECEGVHSNGFFVSSERLDITIGHMMGIILFGITFVIAIAVLIRWLFKIGKKTAAPSVLLVYPCVPCHAAVVNAFEWVLERLHFTVSLIYGDGDAGALMCRKYEEATAIVLISSQKLPENTSTPWHPWADRFQPTVEFICSKIFGDGSFYSDQKKLAKVFLSYSDKNDPHVKKLKSFGKTFDFPNEIDRLILYLSNLRPRCPSLCFYRSSSNDLASFCEGQELLLRIKHAEEAIDVDSNSSCGKVDCSICQNDMCQYKFLFHTCSKCKGWPLNKSRRLTQDSSV